MAENRYDDPALMQQRLASESHRKIVGGRWDEIGRLQLTYLKSVGLSPDQSLVDIGCGALRGGQHFIAYLKAGHYFGFDLNRELIDAGLKNEIQPQGLMDKVRPENMAAAEHFAFPESWRGIDQAIALSLFTHLTLNSIIECLQKTYEILRPKALLHSSVFAVAAEQRNRPIHHKDGIITYPARDPFHYDYCDLLFAAEKTGFELMTIREFSHPRGQKMAVFKRL